jgi:hypothetical protein
LTSDEIMHVLRLTAMSRVNHPDQQRFCEALEKVFAKLGQDGCEHCVMPEGEHMRHCPSNPLPLEKQDVVGLTASGKAARRKKAD